MHELSRSFCFSQSHFYVSASVQVTLSRKMPKINIFLAFVLIIARLWRRRYFKLPWWRRHTNATAMGLLDRLRECWRNVRDVPVRSRMTSLRRLFPVPLRWTCTACCSEIRRECQCRGFYRPPSPETRLVYLWSKAKGSKANKSYIDKPCT